MRFNVFAPLLCGSLIGSLAATAEELPRGADEIVFREGVAVAPTGRSGRSPVHEDAVEALIVNGTWTTPNAGDAITLPNGSTRNWEAVIAGENGVFMNRALSGGYLSCTISSDQDNVMILDVAGSNMQYVNGQPRTGDPYQHGYVRLPVRLRSGANEFLFQGGRGGSLRAKLTPIRGPFTIETGDVTAPDLIVGQPVKHEAAVVVVNATTNRADDLEITAKIAGGPIQRTAVGPMPPLSVRKAGFQMIGPAPDATGECEIELGLVRSGAAQEPLENGRIKLRVLSPDATQKRTFRSAIDGSVQYFAVVPPAPAAKPDSDACDVARGVEPPDGVAGADRPALVLTLHGAGVEALGQAACYSPKPGVVTVAPTNRRPFGFDWEDWGRLDAIEVLERAQAEFGTDPNRTYLTGHSMGGHGTWHVGVTFPDRFAAIGPSAGWVSMFSYAGAGRPNAQNQAEPLARIGELLNRCMNPSDTLALKRNYLNHGVYVLHGEKDDNVPVTQARTMKQQLESMHPDFVYYEEPGVGHWWGKDLAEFSDANTKWGTACVDWPPMFHFFVKHSTATLDSSPHVEFVTASPGVSARCRWVTIEAQTVQLRPSSVQIDFNSTMQKVVGTTENVARLALDLDRLGRDRPKRLELDGQQLTELPRSQPSPVVLTRENNQWSVQAANHPELKNPSRYGTFKDSFRNHVLLAYGSRGSSIDNELTMAKARYDAEQFWYRGNGSIEVVSDIELVAGLAATPPRYADRNIVLYGNADTNAAWPILLSESPVQVREDRITVGDRSMTGTGLACLFVRPRPHSDTAYVAAVSGSGTAGFRLTERFPYFTSGVAYPDLFVVGTDTLENGLAGVRIAGFFGLDWSVTAGELAWSSD